jgi:hypothetical protein
MYVVTLKMETILSYEKSVLTRATYQLTEFFSQRRENLKSYILAAEAAVRVHQIV